MMQLKRIKAVHGYKAPRRIAGKPSVVAPNRAQQQFAVVRANQVWVIDITYIRTWQGWLYLAVFIVLFARNVVGWSMKLTLNISISYRYRSDYQCCNECADAHNSDLRHRMSDMFINP